MSTKVTLNPESLQAWVADNAEAKRYDYQMPYNTRVLDIGGCIGDFYRPAVARWPQSKFVVFEPTEYANSIPMRSWDELVKAAAWIYDGEVGLGGNFFATGLYEPDQKSYKCVDICRWLKAPAELAKINIEGCEYKLLQCIIKSGTITNIRNLQVQFHCIEDEPYQQWYEEIAAELSKTHELQWRYDFVWESWKLKESV